MTRKPTEQFKFTLVIEAIKLNTANREQFNYESECELGKIYAIKIGSHRFYTLIHICDYKELYICRYGKKETQKNDKKLTDTINSIKRISIQKQLSDE